MLNVEQHNIIKIWKQNNKTTNKEVGSIGHKLTKIGNADNPLTLVTSYKHWKQNSAALIIGTMS